MNLLIIFFRFLASSDPGTQSSSLSSLYSLEISLSWSSVNRVLHFLAVSLRVRHGSPAGIAGTGRPIKMYLNMRSFQNIRQNEWENRKFSFYWKIGRKMRGEKNEISNSLSRDVTAAMLVSLYKRTEIMLVFPTNPSVTEFYSYEIFSFVLVKRTRWLITWVKTLHKAPK